MLEWLGRHLPARIAAILAGLWYAVLIWLIAILSQIEDAGFAYWAI